MVTGKPEPHLEQARSPTYYLAGDFGGDVRCTWSHRRQDDPEQLFYLRAVVFHMRAERLIVEVS